MEGWYTVWNNFWCIDQRFDIQLDHHTGITFQLVGSHCIISTALFLYCITGCVSTHEKKESQLTRVGIRGRDGFLWTRSKKE